MKLKLSEKDRAALAEKIRKGVRKLGGCWLPTATTKYHQTSVGGRRYGTRRLAYFLFLGTDPGRKEVVATCGNPRCLNPRHLKLSDQVVSKRTTS